MNRALPLPFRLWTILARWLGSAGQAGAGPLNPLDFSPVGPFPTLGGTYTFDTNGPFPTLTGPGGGASGVFFNGIAVFDFSAITVGSNQVFTGTGAFPLALRSRGDITVNGVIDVSGITGNTSGAGGPGGGAGAPLGTDSTTSQCLCPSGDKFQTTYAVGTQWNGSTFTYTMKSSAFTKAPFF
jgi:hypothetical protein